MVGPVKVLRATENHARIEQKDLVTAGLSQGGPNGGIICLVPEGEGPHMLQVNLVATAGRTVDVLQGTVTRSMMVDHEVDVAEHFSQTNVTATRPSNQRGFQDASWCVRNEPSLYQEKGLTF